MPCAHPDGRVLPAIDYLDWIDGRPARATHDLATSELRPGEGGDGVGPASLDGRPAPDDATVREQVAAIYDVSPDRVLLTPGASTANAVAALAAVAVHGSGAGDDAGDGRVLVEKPGYEPLYRTPEAFGVPVDRFVRPQEAAFGLDPDRVDAAVRDAHACVTVTNRHNPSGRRTEREELATLARVAADSDATLLVDEVYAPYVGDERATAGAFGGVTAAGLPNTAVTGSLTKFYGLGGLRVGWIVADPAVIEAARGIARHFPSLADPSLALARRALANREALSTRAREHCEATHDLLAEFVADRPALSGPVFDGSTYAVLAHDRADGDAVAAAAWEAGVLVVPGRFFELDDRFRVSLGAPPERTAAGLDALGSVLDGL